jgi:predicted lipoprotein with Yx(FWY)xxD motif
VGSYLTDAAGRTLYTYGGDLPGDCQNAPQSTCVADCLVSWPVFDAGDRLLGADLDDGLFGEILRPDGSKQTTYRGWPLYYYKSDLTLGQMTGQGKGKIWHVAEVSLPSVTVMKSGTLKYLADIDGRTLYVSSADQAGTSDADPVSNCQGSCLQTFEAFHEKNFSAVTVLESSDFQVFVRHGAGGLQLSYKGMPLYRAATDLKSGDMTGATVEGFTAAVP